GDLRSAGPDPSARRRGEESLARIASLSGGQLFRGSNDPGVALSDILEMSRHYYLLAFEPRELKGSGRFHKVRVKVKGKDLRLSYRSGYFERPSYESRTPLAREFEAAEMVAKAVDRGEIGLRALAVPYRAQEGTVTLPVVLELDGASLLAGREAGEMSLEIYG